MGYRSLIYTHANRAAMLEGEGWTDAFGRGWKILKRNVGPSLTVGLITVGVSIATGLVPGGAMWLFLAKSTLAPGSAPLGSPARLLIAFSSTVGLMVGTLYQVYASALRTLTYCQLVPPDMRSPRFLNRARRD